MRELYEILLMLMGNTIFVSLLFFASAITLALCIAVEIIDLTMLVDYKISYKWRGNLHVIIHEEINHENC